MAHRRWESNGLFFFSIRCRLVLVVTVLITCWFCLLAGGLSFVCYPVVSNFFFRMHCSKLDRVGVAADLGESCRRQESSESSLSLSACTCSGTGLHVAEMHSGGWCLERASVQ